METRDDRVVVRLVLKNVPYRATPSDIARFCAAVGTVMDVTMPHHKDTGLRTEFVFVTLRLYSGRPREDWHLLDAGFIPEPGSATMRMIEVEEANRTARRRGGGTDGETTSGDSGRR